MLTEEKTLVNVRKGIYSKYSANKRMRRKRNVTERRHNQKYRMDFQAISLKLLEQVAGRWQTGTRVWTARIPCVINLNLDLD